MTRYVLKRLILLPALLFLFSVTVFAIVQAPPGDFLTTYVATLASSGSSINAEQVEALRREYGLDRPYGSNTCAGSRTWPRATSASRSSTSGRTPSSSASAWC
jgi:ABC-type dipeptide/oligopeptide/nickel transport system permease component